MLLTTRYISDSNIEGAKSRKRKVLRLRYTINLVAARITSKTHLASMI
jgi:hypothetical protein